MRWVVSVEGLSVPARNAVLKCLHNRLGLALLDIDRQHAHPLRQLLHRMQALAKVSDPATGVVWAGSWLLDAPADPVWSGLHSDLARGLAGKLLPRGSVANTTHLMVVLDADADVDEAFEALLCPDACQNATRELSLEHLRTAKAKLATADPARVTPFQYRIVRVACPTFAADNPSTLAAVCESAVRECLKAMAGAV